MAQFHNRYSALGSEVGSAMQTLDQFFNSRQVVPVEFAMRIGSAASAYRTLVDAYRIRRSETLAARPFARAWENEANKRWRLQQILEQPLQIRCRKKLWPIVKQLIEVQYGTPSAHKDKLEGHRTAHIRGGTN